MGVAGDVTWDHGGVLDVAAPRSHVWVHGPAPAMVCYPEVQEVISSLGYSPGMC